MSKCGTLWKGILPFISHRCLPTTVIVVAIFLPLVDFSGNFRPDLSFVTWMVPSYLILIIREDFELILPAYWPTSLLAILLLARPYGDFPSFFKQTALLSLLRCWHVGLLTSRSGYGTDITLFKKNKLLTSTLVSLSLFIDVSATFVVMRVLNFSAEASILMAVISPAPSPEVSLPLFKSMTSSCDPAEDDPGVETETETEAKRTRLAKHREEFADTLNVFKTTALPLILITIAAFCAITSGIDLSPDSGGESLVIQTDWMKVVKNAIYGILVAFACSGVLFLMGLTAVAKETPPNTLAPLLVSFASLSMFYFGNFVPVAAAIAAIGGCLFLRTAMGHDEQASAILSRIWPYTSQLYYSTFAYGVFGHYNSNKLLLGEHWLKLLAGSLVPFLIKFFTLTVVTRRFRKSWPSSLTLALSLCSKGTVQIALSPILLLAIQAVPEANRDLTDVGSLQLFVIINYLSILPCIYFVSWITSRCLKR